METNEVLEKRGGPKGNKKGAMEKNDILDEERLREEDNIVEGGVLDETTEGIDALGDAVRGVFNTAVANIQAKFELEIARLRDETTALRKEKQALEEEKLQMSKTLPLPKKVSLNCVEMVLRVLR